VKPATQDSKTNPYVTLGVLSKNIFRVSIQDHETLSPPPTNSKLRKTTFKITSDDQYANNFSDYRKPQTANTEAVSRPSTFTNAARYSYLQTRDKSRFQSINFD
jgi:hypothetical protein